MLMLRGRDNDLLDEPFRPETHCHVLITWKWRESILLVVEAASANRRADCGQ